MGLPEASPNGADRVDVTPDFINRWLWKASKELVPAVAYPLIIRGGTLSNGHRVRYILNYSASPQRMAYDFPAGTELLTGRRVASGGQGDGPGGRTRHRKTAFGE